MREIKTDLTDKPFIYSTNGVFRVGIDCDDTIMYFQKAYWDLYNKIYNDNVDYRLVNMWGFHNFAKPYIKPEDLMNLLYTEDFFRHKNLRWGTHTLMTNLIAENFSIYLVTDVPVEKDGINPRQDRLDNVKDKMPYFDQNKIVFTADKTKTGLGLLVLLDDKPETYFKCIEEGIEIILMDAPHNRDIENVKYRAKNPKEAFKMVIEIRENELRKTKYNMNYK
jgi:5'(3')-deoxyribonucleotidase